MLVLSESYSTELGFDDLTEETAFDKLSRSQMIDFVCRMKSRECLSHMHSKLKSHIDMIEILPVDSEASVFCFGLMASVLADEGSELVEALWRKMQASGNSEYRLRIIKSLGCFNDKKVLFGLLETILGATTEVRYLTAENFEIIQSVYSASFEGVEATMDFMIEYQNDAVRRSQKSNLMEILVEKLPEKIFEEKSYEKVKNLKIFFKRV